LIETPDLTGEWVLFATDNFRSDDASLPDNGNCAAARILANELSKANISRAQRALQLTVPGQTSRAQVEMHVRVFDSPATAQDFLKRSRTVLTSDSYIRCLADGFQAQFGPNARVKFGDARGRAPRDGITSAFDQDLKVEDTVYQLHTDSYTWVQNNVYVLVLISGPRGLDTNDFVKEALDKTQQKVDAAFKLPQ
jgi:hypothetical protein